MGWVVEGGDWREVERGSCDFDGVAARAPISRIRARARVGNAQSWMCALSLISSREISKGGVDGRNPMRYIYGTCTLSALSGFSSGLNSTFTAEEARGTHDSPPTLYPGLPPTRPSGVACHVAQEEGNANWAYVQ